MPDEAPLEWTTAEEDELFLMTNLYPRRTGLPVTVFVSPRSGGHDIRVKVSVVPGNRMTLEGAAVVGVRPEPRLIHGRLDADVLSQVTAWIRLNEAALIDHWNGLTDGGDLALQIKPLPA